MTYNEMLSTINFNIQDPWNYDFYFTPISASSDQEFANLMFPNAVFAEDDTEKSFNFFRGRALTFMYVAKTTSFIEGATVSLITDVPEESSVEPTPTE
jgi:hypothetical protein